MCVHHFYKRDSSGPLGSDVQANGIAILVGLVKAALRHVSGNVVQLVSVSGGVGDGSSLHVKVEDGASSPFLERRHATEGNDDDDEESKVGNDGANENDPPPALRFRVEEHIEGITVVVEVILVLEARVVPSRHSGHQFDHVARRVRYKTQLPTRRKCHILLSNKHGAPARRKVRRTCLFYLHKLVNRVLVNINVPSRIRAAKIRVTIHSQVRTERPVEGKVRVLQCDFQALQNHHRTSNNQIHRELCVIRIPSTTRLIALEQINGLIQTSRSWNLARSCRQASRWWPFCFCGQCCTHPIQISVVQETAHNDEKQDGEGRRHSNSNFQVP